MPVEKSGIDRLKVICSDNNWEVENVEPDGDCMFSSLAIQLGRREEMAAYGVRSELVEYLRYHADMVSSTFS